MASIINTGLSALNAFKRQMETTGHNIANVNTEGYSRQRADLVTRLPQENSIGYTGAGVDLVSVRRSYDDYLALRVRDYSSSYEESSVFYSRARQVDNVIADQSAGIDGILQDFFAAMNDVADDPTSVEARAVLLNRANQLADRFNSLDRWFSDIRNQLGQDLEREVNEINAIGQSIVEINERIGSLNGIAEQIPADILDERDRLVDELSRYTNVSSVENADGTLGVFVGTGQALVLGVNRNQLTVQQNPQDPERAEILIQQAGNATVNITNQMTGGSLGGLVRFRDEILDESHNALGRVALGIATFFNEQHALGMDLDGDLGGDFFRPIGAPKVLGDDTDVTATYTNVGDLTTHDYQLTFDGTVWQLEDLTTGANVPIVDRATGLAANSATTAITTSGAGIGFEMTVANPPASGDSYRIRPTRHAANEFAVQVSSERDIAAADYLTTLTGPAAGGGPNTGTGVISAGRIDSLQATSTPATALPDIDIVFNGGNLDLSGGPAGTEFVDAAGSPLGNSVGLVSGSTYYVNVNGFGTYRFEVTGAPNDGDRFRIIDNSGKGTEPMGIGDNRNARSLADLQKANLMIGGTATFTNTYGSLIADVGTRTQQAETNASIQQNLLGQAESAKSEVSGVNLDEEAADLVRFQQAYQAAAQVISIANSLFDSLLGAVRR